MSNVQFHNGTNWEDIAPDVALEGVGVTSVFGRTGDVSPRFNDYTWTQVDKTASSIGDITNRSHVLLTDVGTHTHAQIDSHLGLLDTNYRRHDGTNGPFSETKVQTESTTALSTSKGDGTNIFNVDTVNEEVVVKKDFINTNPDLPDMGYEDRSDLRGYGLDYISDKRLANCTLGSNESTANGGIRVDNTQDPDAFEVFLRGFWQSIIYDLTTEHGDFRHRPIDTEIYVWRGDSVLLGLNNQPVVQEYTVSMGAYPAFKINNGGTF